MTIDESILKKLNLPFPTADEIFHSQRLEKLIIDEIHQHQNKISFHRFMELALYAPSLGYYSAGTRKFGKDGDFSTAPEISSLFSYCLAKQCAEVISSLEAASILEFGAGTGVMAADILIYLEKINCLPEYYYILEVSADLIDRQKELIHTRCPHLFAKVVWLTQLPEKPFHGVILANEVLDAMPVHQFVCDHENIYENYVSYKDNQFINIIDVPGNVEIESYIRDLKKQCFSDMPYYTSEINVMATAWLSSIEKFFQQGIILLIDYGFPQREYYLPQRHMGTLMCHYRHRAHSNPLILVGLQDITAHVDFTKIAYHAHDVGLTVSGYIQQAGFLLNCGLLECAQESARDDLQKANEIKLLTLPSEMGELFKVMALTKSYDEPLLGFSKSDIRHKL